MLIFYSRYTYFIFSFWIGYYDIQWLRTWKLFWNSLDISMLSSFERHQSNSPNGVHFQPNVFRVHECQGKWHLNLSKLEQKKQCLCIFRSVQFCCFCLVKTKVCCTNNMLKNVLLYHHIQKFDVALPLIWNSIYLVY